MSEVGFEVSGSRYVHRETVNRKEGLTAARVFVQGKFIKPQTPELDVQCKSVVEGHSTESTTEGMCGAVEDTCG